MIALVQGKVAASCNITLLLNPTSEKTTEEEARKSRIADLLFNVARCLIRAEIEAMFEVLKLRAEVSCHP